MSHVSDAENWSCFGNKEFKSIYKESEEEEKNGVAPHCLPSMQSRVVCQDRNICLGKPAYLPSPEKLP